MDCSPFSSCSGHFSSTSLKYVGQQSKSGCLIQVAESRKLHGRFLQVTDLHPDPYYKARTSSDKACHRKKPKKKKRRAGYFGTPYSYVAYFVCRVGVPMTWRMCAAAVTATRRLPSPTSHSIIWKRRYVLLALQPRCLRADRV